MGLKLSKEQESEMLTARRRMLNKLNALVENRRAIISQLGMELLQTARVSQPETRFRGVDADVSIFRSSSSGPGILMLSLPLIPTASLVSSKSERTGLP